MFKIQYKMSFVKNEDNIATRDINMYLPIQYRLYISIQPIAMPVAAEASSAFDQILVKCKVVSVKTVKQIFITSKHAN